MLLSPHVMTQNGFSVKAFLLMGTGKVTRSKSGELRIEAVYHEWIPQTTSSRSVYSNTNAKFSAFRESCSSSSIDCRPSSMPFVNLGSRLGLDSPCT
ncbi:hypothetical protein TNCV_1379321 [Trichonephila clavipes]|nr:hypothetical protein TNCV_1379321 [Trichonephila clavipes]